MCVCVLVCTPTAAHMQTVHMCGAFECNQLIHVCSDRRFEPADLKYKNETRSLQTHVSSTRACCVHIWCIANTFNKNNFTLSSLVHLFYFFKFKVIVAFSFFRISILHIFCTTAIHLPDSFKRKFYLRTRCLSKASKI